MAADTNDIKDLSERVTAIESWQEHVATKSDISRLEGIIATEIGRLEGTMATNNSRLEGIIATEIGRLEGTMATNNSRLGGTIASEVSRLEGTIVRLEGEMNTRFARLEGETMAAFARQEGLNRAEFARLEVKIDTGLNDHRIEMERIREMLKWVLIAILLLAALSIPEVIALLPF